jgi:hypothetical protein
MNGTELFLGDGDARKSAAVELRSVHGLYGGVNLRFTGDGLLLLQVVRVGRSRLEEKCYARRLPDEAAGVFEEIGAGDFLNIKLSDRTGLPDEVWLEIVVTNAAGDERTVGAWEQTTQSPDSYGTSGRKLFDDVHLLLRRLKGETEERETPLYEGKYRNDGWQIFLANPPSVEAVREPTVRSADEGPAPGEVPAPGEGSITLSGGCEVYGEGTIRFLPGTEGIEVVVENREGNPWFLDERGDPCGTIRTVPTAEVLEPFFDRLRSVIEAGNPPESVSTRDARVQIRLPLPEGRIEADWWELADEEDVDTLVEVIESFVDEIAGAAGGR